MQLNRLWTASLISLALITPAAAEVGLNHGLNPAFTDLGIAIKAARGIVGLTPGQAAIVRLAAVGKTTAICVNQNTGNSKPTVQEPADTVVAGLQIIRGKAISDTGRARMDVVTFPPPEVVDGAPDCRNPDKSSEEITDLSFTSAVVTIEQPIGTQVFQLNCTINPPTSNGIVVPTTVTCAKP
jgi:hypothetical protein